MHPCTLKSTYPWSVWIVIHQIWMISSTSKHVEIESYPGLFPLVTVAYIGLAWDLVLKRWYHLGGNWNPGWKRAYQDVPHFFPEHSKALFPTYFFGKAIYLTDRSTTHTPAEQQALPLNLLLYEETHNILNSALKKNQWHEIVNGMNSATRSSTTDL